MLKYFHCFFIIFIASISFSAQTKPAATAQDFFEKGVNLLREGKLNDALEAFRQSAQIDSKQPATQANIGSLLIQLNRAGEAVQPFREAVRLAPNDVLSRIGLCRSLSLLKNHDEAVAQCEEAVRLGDSAPETHIALIFALKAANRSAEIIQKSENALQKFPEQEVLLNLSAEAQTGAGNFARALEIYETLARLHPNSANYQTELAENYLRFERDAEAIAAARKALEIEPLNPAAYYYLGRVFLELGQTEEAAQNFQKAIDIDAKFTEAFFYLGVAEKRRNHLDKAVSALRQAVKFNPDDSSTNLEFGNALNAARLFEEAIPVLQKASALNPKYLETKVALSFALVYAGRFDEGISVLREADRLRPNDQTIMMFLGVAEARKEGAAQIDLMKSIAAKNPNDAAVRESLTNMLIALRRFEEAEPYIRQLTKISKPSGEFYNGIGVSYSEMNQPEKALEYYRKAAELKPHHVIYLSMADALMKLGRAEEADEAFQKGLEIKPDSIYVLKSYADFLRDQGKRREALEMYKRAVAVAPLDPPVVYNLAFLYVKTGNLELAKQYYQTLKTIDPVLAKTLNRYLRSL